MGFCRPVALVCLLAGSASLAPLGAQGGWKAGVAKAVITPRESIWMAGFGARTKPSEGVLQDIWAKAVAFQDETGTTTVLVTTDLLGFTRSMADTVAGRVEQKYRIPRERLALTSSHTHSGPVTGELLRPAYDMPKEQEAVIARYTGWLLEEIVTVVGKAVADLAPAQLAFEQGLAGFAVNRRRVGHREYPGPVDQDVPVLSVRAPDGKLRAVVFGYACHNTNLSGYQINGDYAGFAQAELEKKYPEAAALFVAGCGADANPLPRGSVELATLYGNILAAAVDLVLAGKMKSVTGPVAAAFERVDLPFQKAPTREQLEATAKGKDAARRRHAEYLLRELERDGRLPDRYPYPVQVWRFGPSLSWIILGGEVVSDYALRFKRLYGADTTWVSGYSNDVFAYIPTLRVLKEGGYEGGGAMIPYGQPAAFRAPIEEIIAEKVDELVQRTAGGAN